MTLNVKLLDAIEQSKRFAIQRMIDSGVPIGVDGIRCDITLHTARGWQPTVIGENVEIPADLPEPSRASHMS